MADVTAVASPQGTKRTRDQVEAEDVAQQVDNATNDDADGKHATFPHPAHTMSLTRGSHILR
jgi:hypothetical protein